MKLSSVLSVLAVSHASDDVVADDTWVGPNAEQTQIGIARKGDRAIDQERRYDDLEAIAKKYWQKNSEGVNQGKIKEILCSSDSVFSSESEYGFKIS